MTVLHTNVSMTELHTNVHGHASSCIDNRNIDDGHRYTFVIVLLPDREYLVLISRGERKPRTTERERNKMAKREWDDKAFGEWMARIDAIIAREYGLTSLDLPDWDYACAFIDGMNASQAAGEVIEQAMEDAGMF